MSVSITELIDNTRMCLNTASPHLPFSHFQQCNSELPAAVLTMHQLTNHEAHDKTEM